MASSSQNLQNFPQFSALPAEIRLRIWQFAAPRRPRVIQVGYNPHHSCWTAWQDGQGGLPSILDVSREARDEALRPYERMFNAYVDPEEDTIFISDPIFSIRKPRRMFMASEHAQKLRKVAFTSEIYNGLARSSDQFPSLCEGPAAVLRGLKGLKHFTLALSEDGAGFEYSEGDDDEGEDEGDGEVEHEDEIDDVGTDAHSAEPSTNNGNAEQEDGADIEETLDENSIVRKLLDRLDDEAMEIMTAGYFRHLGDIHFESASGHSDHWEAWELYRDELEIDCEQEKERFPDWIRPTVSVMAVEYGLRRPGDFGVVIHLLGDHNGVLEAEGNSDEFPDYEYVESDTSV